ncbi:MAG: hypothetical protein WC375_04670 [Methanomassiliicoccales archaeon]|jgi:SAM-dependent methyltransferase
MMVATLFGLEEVYFLESSYEMLIDNVYTDQFLTLEGKEARVLIDEGESPIAMAVKADRWYAISLLHRAPTDTLIEALEGYDLEVYRTSRSDFTKATREYFSILLEHDNKPAMEEFSEQRMKNVVELIKQSFGKNLKGKTCLDVGCGTGLGSAALHKLGMNAAAYDLDPSLLSRGLTEGRLYHHETMRIDGTRANCYIEPVDHSLVLMAGKITEFNSFLWKQIIKEAFGLSRSSLITVETEPEARMVESWCPKGMKVKVFEDERDPFYDRWVILVKG